MRYLHLSTGVIVLIVFALTGQYMILGLELPEQQFDVQRMMYRASHMYLFFAGALNVGVGCYWHYFDSKISRIFQITASFFMVLAQPVLLFAFWVEPGAVDHDRIATLAGCVLVLAGVLLSLIGSIISRVCGGKNT